jgi:hypothetical protein
MTTVSCPHCSQSLELPDHEAGNTVRCPKCEQTFATPVSSALASGEPPARSVNADAGVTEKTPSPKAPGEPDFSDFPVPRERRDVAEKRSLVLPIVLVAGAAMLGLCVCAAPGVIFLGLLLPVRMARQEEAHAVAAQVEAQRAAEDQAVVAREEARAAEDQAVAAWEKAQREALDHAARAKAAKAPGFVKGVADAMDAIAKDRLLLKEYPPLPAPGWHGEYTKLLKERCKCEYQVIGAAKLPKDQEDEIWGWNETMRAELRLRHGATIIEDLNKEAEKRWRARLKPKEKK